MRILNFLFILFISLGIQSCKKDLGDCFKSTGEITTEFRELNSVSNIILRDNINLMLIPSDSNGIEITAGKNLLNKINSYQTGDTLELSNTNSCNWVRDFSKEITAKVFVKDLMSVSYRSIGDINCSDTLYSDSLKIDVYEGAGSIDLLSVTPFLKTAIHYGTADIKISGRAQVTQVYSASWGLTDLRDMNTEFCYINNSSSNDVYVYVNRTLSVSISGIGNVFYKGDPINISQDIAGSGRLLKLEK
ncbi:MAG: hypothetical protein C0598_03775 [Marinilabiliales bacterium]|nr:MAG: hypothetical protein C0598_03775 [Marinilabiliales bacterium]